MPPYGQSTPVGSGGGAKIGCAVDQAFARAMELQLLGPVVVTVDGCDVPLGPPKQRALLAMLALEADRVVPVERLIHGLWGDSPPESASKMVQHYVSRLRGVLSVAGVEIVTRGRGTRCGCKRSAWTR